MSIGALPKRFACQRQTVSYDSLHWFKSDELSEAHLRTLQRRTRSDPPLGIAPTIRLVCGTVPAAPCGAGCFAPAICLVCGTVPAVTCGAGCFAPASCLVCGTVPAATC